MTEWRAADLIRQIKRDTADRYVDRHKAFDLAIKALEEIERYKAIGTVEELKGLKESNLSGLELAMIAVSVEKLKKYEDLEGQGKLLKLPCAVGDTIYVLDRDGKPREMILDEPDIRCHCAKEDNLCMALCDRKKAGVCAYRFKNDRSDIGERVFLTKEAAEAALKEMGNDGERIGKNEKRKMDDF